MPALDGLRAFAVAAVIAYHLNLSRAGGGYLGVDVFFVLSGFLITGLLVEERTRSGRIAFRAFWARRARRLLPALLVVLAALAIYAGLNGPGLDRSTLRPDALATLFYSANWHLIFAHQSYFAQFSAPSPLKHTWSLAIEEQFYLLWPLMLVVLLKATRGSRRLLLGAIAGLAGASAALMAVLYHPGVDPSRIYYGTDTRAFELLIGAALAVAATGRFRSGTPSRGRRLLPTAGLLAMGLLVYFCTSAAGPPGWMWQGGLFATGVLTAVVIASVSGPRSGPLGAVLSLPPLRWIGIISYGLYLWHWPVIVLMTDTNTGLSGWPLKGAQVGTMLALATTSYVLVERPIRRARLKAWRAWVAAPIGVGATAAALLFTTVAPTAVATAAAPARIAPAPVSPESPSVLVLGDSTALELSLGMAEQASPHGLAVHNDAFLGCSIVDGFTAENTDGTTVQFSQPPDCRWRSRLPQQLDQTKPKVALLWFGPWDTADHLIGGRWLRVGTPEWVAYYQDQLTQMTSLLESRGAHVMIATVPVYHPQPQPDHPTPTMAQPSRVDALNGVYRSFVAAHPDVTLYDLASRVTSADLRDGVHLGDKGQRRVGDLVDGDVSLVAKPTIALPPGRALSPADPLRVMIIGDSLMHDASPGVVAALESTGVVKVVVDTSALGWGLTATSRWVDQWPQVISQYRPEVVLGMWSWDDGAAKADPVGYTRLVDDAMGKLMSPGNGVDGAVIMQTPRTGPSLLDTDPVKRAQHMAEAEAGRQAWNSLMASLPPQWPGRYVYLPVAASLEVNGQYSSWLPEPGGTWSRARKLDNAHFCPTGAAALGQAVLQGLTPVFQLPPAAGGWWAGSWTRNATFDDPPGSCPNDKP